MACCDAGLCGRISEKDIECAAGKLKEDEADNLIVLRCSKCLVLYDFKYSCCPKKFGCIGKSKNASWKCKSCVDGERVPEFLDFKDLPTLEGHHGGLPIDSVLDELRASLQTNRVTVVEGAPGTGKTFRTPGLCKEIGAHRVLVVLPTSAGALSTAKYYRAQRGGSVICRTSLSDDTGWDADVIYVTYKFLQKWLLQYGCKRLCQAYDAILLDEIHILLPSTIALLALLRKTLPYVRTTLVLMSATMPETSLKEFFKHLGCGHIFIKARQYNLQRRFVCSPEGMEVCYAAKAISMRWTHVNEGVLVFLAGTEEIKSFIKVLKTILGDDSEDEEFLGVPYFVLKRGCNKAALASHGKRIILATEAGAISITLTNVALVVNTCMVKRERRGACGFPVLLRHPP